MTALVFLVSLTLAYLLYQAGQIFIVDGVTIYVAAFLATLSTAVFYALRSMLPRLMVAALVLIGNFAGSHYAWQTDDPIMFSAMLDVVTAAYFVLVGITRWELAIGGLYLLSVGAAVLAQFGVMHDHTTRPGVFIALSYPDVAALIGHAANITLGVGSGDSGRLARIALQVRPVVARHRRGTLARRGLVDPLAPRQEEG